MPLSDSTKKYLGEVKKGQPRKFVMICKGVKILNLIVYKVGNENTFKKKAKEEGNGKFYTGVITGKAMNITFQLARDRYEKFPGKKLVLKEFLEKEAEMKFKPKYEIVDSLTEI